MEEATDAIELRDIEKTYRIGDDEFPILKRLLGGLRLDDLRSGEKHEGYSNMAIQ